MNFQDVRRALEAGVPVGMAADMHGLLCGMLCGPGAISEDDWLDEVVQTVEESDPVVAGQRPVLRALFEETRRQLDSADLDFLVLLPDDETPLAVRGDAFRSWCEMFLLGLSAAGLEAGAGLSEDVSEIIADISEFTRLDEDDVESEELEVAYAELVEYARVGALLINEEFHANDAPGDAGKRE
jgi:uncharacterized protein